MEQKLQTYNNNLQIQEIKLDKAIQKFLERQNYEYYDIQKVDIETNEDIDFIKISHISYDRNQSQTDLNLIDFQQLLSAVASKSKKFVYMIESSSDGIDLYIGTTKEPNNTFLKDTFEGIYSGSTLLDDNKTKPFSNDMKHSKAMLGIPALKKDSDKEYKQSLEKILFPMQGKSFRIVLVAQSYDLETIQDIISNYQTLGNELHRFVKQSRNEQNSHADSKGITLTEGSSISNTKGKSSSKSHTDTVGVGVYAGGGFSAGIGFIVNAGTNVFAGASLNYSHSYGRTKSESISRTNSTNESSSSNNNTTKTETLGITFDEINKSAEYCENLIDTYIERFQKGLNHGMWNSSLYIQAENESVLLELEHTLKSVYSGDESYYESIRFSNNLIENKDIEIEKLPMLYFDKKIKHPIHPSFVGFSSALNTEELSILSALPNNDVEGLSVSKISSFGLTQSKNIDKHKSMEIGVVLNKKKPTNQRFKLSNDALNSHLFVSGITGSGKSNTIKLILNELQSENIEKKIPFLVIEPAKSEYKHLLKTIPNLQIFRPGAKYDIFKLNPFVFEHNKNNKSVTLTKHVDMLKTAFSSAFPMYGPMPYILEDAIHKIYEDKGWNFNTEDNPLFTNSSEGNYDRMTLLFPNMEDLNNKIESVVDESGYAGELDSNIKAALKTRIKNLTIGAKGRIFNSRHSFNSKILFEKSTIIELSSIVDDEEKSFLMGLLLNKLYQYREEQGSFNELKHITVIEEAHRLLPNISLDKNSEEANSKAKAVETFTNILAEIRSYGEGIIVADQIASKLHSDVIKNTNIKIIQRTMDREDRELVGNSINLNEDQILDIAELKPGEAIVHNTDVHQAFMVKIDEIDSIKIEDDNLIKFNEEFLSRHDNYRYEIIQEHRFYVPISELLEIKNMNKMILKSSMLKLINSAFFDENNVINNWNSFKNNIKKIKNKNIYFYLALEAYNEFRYISNMQYYNDVDCYLDTYKGFLRFIKSLIDENFKELSKAIQNLKIKLLHENIKEVFPSMKYYATDNIDYTLLVLENITTDEEVYTYIYDVMQEDISLNNRFDKILKKIFHTTSPELRYSLGAIRSGTNEIDFNILIKEGF
jgi:DNA helicase HerA-like ATPase